MCGRANEVYATVSIDQRIILQISPHGGQWRHKHYHHMVTTGAINLKQKRDNLVTTNCWQVANKIFMTMLHFLRLRYTYMISLQHNRKLTRITCQINQSKLNWILSRSVSFTHEIPQCDSFILKLARNNTNNCSQIVNKFHTNQHHIPVTFSLKIKYKICWNRSSFPECQTSASSRSISLTSPGSSSSFSGQILTISEVAPFMFSMNG